MSSFLLLWSVTKAKQINSWILSIFLAFKKSVDIGKFFTEKQMSEKLRICTKQAKKSRILSYINLPLKPGNTDEAKRFNYVNKIQKKKKLIIYRKESLNFFLTMSFFLNVGCLFQLSSSRDWNMSRHKTGTPYLILEWNWSKKALMHLIGSEMQREH